DQGGNRVHRDVRVRGATVHQHALPRDGAGRFPVRGRQRPLPPDHGGRLLMARLVLRASDCAPSSSRRRPAGARGYLIVEAAMALPVYLLFMLLVMKLSAVAVAPAKVTVAVNQAAIALSQASYVRSAAVTSDAADVIDLVEDLVG